MTEDEFNNLSKREIDRLIAEDVMGWTLLNYNTDKIDDNWELAQSNDGWSWLDVNCDFDGEAYEWSPTSKTNQSMMVLDHFKSLTEAPEITLKYYYDGMWSCELNGKGSVQFYGRATADTLEMSICKAALIAKGVITS